MTVCLGLAHRPAAGTWGAGDACRLRNVPVWPCHGAKDGVVPIAGDQAMVDSIRSCGGSAHLTVYPDTGRDAWTAAYADPQLYQWLLHQRRRLGGN